MTSFLGATTNLRVGDAERTEVADLLARHFGDGRLDRSEFDERVEAAMRAKTRADLDRLLTDLPRLEAPGTSPARRRRLPVPLVLVPLVWFALFVLVVGVVAHGVVHVVVGPWVLLLVAFLVLRRRGRRHWRHHHEHYHYPYR